MLRTLSDYHHCVSGGPASLTIHRMTFGNTGFLLITIRDGTLNRGGIKGKVTGSDDWKVFVARQKQTITLTKLIKSHPQGQVLEVGQVFSALIQMTC